jgi:pseudouridylate synthase
MYVNKCTKCGAEFETKNPKRVICPNCLYPDKKPGSETGSETGENSQNQSQNGSSYERPASYSAGGYSTDSYPRRDDRPYQQQDRPRYDGQRSYNQGGYQRPQQGGYNRPQGGYQRPQGGYNNDRGYDRPRAPRPYDRNDGQRSYNQGGYQRPQQGGYSRSQGGYQRPQQGGYNRPQGGFNRPQGNRRPMGGGRPQRPPKQLLVNKEQLAQIEELYKKMLPLPNPDAHEVIGEQIGLEARKVFFGINLVRQKMMLPKLAFPKRKLAVSPDQLTAIKMLYEPLLPLPPIGCHKIISAQLKIDEWRVHVGIGLIRKQLGLDRWNPEREDAPAEFKQQAQKEASEAVKTEEKAVEQEAPAEEKPKKRGRKKAEPAPEETAEPVKEDE